MSLVKKGKVRRCLRNLVSIILAGGGLLALSGAGPAPALGAEDLFRQGQEIFANNCARCHQLHGGGLAGKFPALNKNPFVVGDPEPVISTVLNGRRGEIGRMPSWGPLLSDGQIAAAVTYIRHAWDNKAPGVTPEMVKAVRRK